MDIGANNVEKIFRAFVRSFGGELIPESTDDKQRADFLFREHNIIAELKTLEQDATHSHNAKMQALASEWMRHGRLVAYGRVRLSLSKLHPSLQREWMAILERPVQELIRKANRQIHDTKHDVKIVKARGLLLIANRGNFLYETPQDYMAVVARVLSKKKPNGDFCFPEIRGVGYFGFCGIRPYWAIGGFDTDTDVSDFQEKLRLAWASYIATGRN